MQTGSPRPTAAPTRFTSFAPAAVPLPLTATGPQPPQDQDQAAGNRPGNGPAKRSRERDDGHPASALAQRARTAAHDQKGVASAAAGPRPTLRLLLDTTGPTPTGLRGTGQPAPTLLDIPPQHRSEADYRAWFRAGRTLAQIPVEQRDELCCRIAIEHAPRALAEVPRG